MVGLCPDLDLMQTVFANRAYSCGCTVGYIKIGGMEILGLVAMPGAGARLVGLVAGVVDCEQSMADGAMALYRFCHLSGSSRKLAR